MTWRDGAMHPFCDWMILMALHHPLVGLCNDWVSLMMRYFPYMMQTCAVRILELGGVCESSVNTCQWHDESCVAKTSVWHQGVSTGAWTSGMDHFRCVHLIWHNLRLRLEMASCKPRGQFGPPWQRWRNIVEFLLAAALLDGVNYVACVQ